MRSNVLLVAVAVGVVVLWAACGSSSSDPVGGPDAGADGDADGDGDGDGDGDADGGPSPDDFTGEHSTSAEPVQFDATEAGFLALGPPGLVVTFGTTAQLDATLHDSTGAVQDENPDVTFESLDPELATVDADGVVTGEFFGVARIVAHSEQYGERQVEVSVAALPESVTMPSAARFVHPFGLLRVGETMPLDFIVTDGEGTELDLPVTLRSLSGDGVVLDGTSVRAVARGFYTIAAVLDDGEEDERVLDGGFFVVVGGDAAPGERTMVACDPLFPTVEFYGGGTGRPFRLQLVEEDERGGFYFTQVAPTRIDVMDDRVVGLVGGVLQARSPGTTRYQLLYGEAVCTCESVHVFPDLNGTWGAECGNGDQGTLSLAHFPTGRVITRKTVPHANPQVPEVPFASGDSCFENEGPPFECTDRGSLSATWAGSRCFREVHMGPCTEDNPCGSLVGGVNPTYCAYDRHVDPGALNRAGQFLGPDVFEHQDCRFERDAAATCGAGVPVVEATFRGQAVPGSVDLLYLLSVNDVPVLEIQYGALQVHFSGPFEVGEFSFEGTEGRTVSGSYDGLYPSCLAGDGSIGGSTGGTITSIDDATETVEGTFYLDLHDEPEDGGIAACSDPADRLEGTFQGSYRYGKQ